MSAGPRAHAPALAAILAAAALWGTTGTTQSLLPPGSHPLAVGALRLAVGALCLLVFAAARTETRRALAQLPWRGVLFAGAAVAAYNLTFFWGVAASGVGVGTAVAIGSAPLWATAIDAVVGGRAPPRIRLIGQVAAVVGVAVLSLQADGAGGAGWGVVAALAAGLSYAAYSLTTTALIDRAPSTSLAAAIFAVGAVIAAPALAILPLDGLATPAAWAGIAFLGIGATGVAYALYSWGLKSVAGPTAVTLALAEPVVAWLLAIAVVGETLTAAKLAGALLILAGLAIVARAPGRR